MTPLTALPLTALPRTALPLEPVRVWIAERIRERVVGDDADGKAAAIFDAPGPRWFDEERIIRRVHADASMFVGGLRALLLQSMHPLAMAGVAQHSDYRTDPWGRLQRTADFLAATTFGTAELAETAVGRVRMVHQRVRGRAADGRPYSANDPHLLRWVHI
ncbi:MAG: oxygenase MpaB family protein, partial [Actinomycetota bacterium]